MKPHVLRYWETQFSMLRPRKNRAGNRMYRPDEVKLLFRIKELLYDRRFTIAGAKRHLLDQRKDPAPQQVELVFGEAERKTRAPRGQDRAQAAPRPPAQAGPARLSGLSARARPPTCATGRGRID